MAATTSRTGYELETRSSSFLYKFVRTDASLAPLVARLTLGLVMFPHGAQKMLGLFGGGGWSKTIGFFTSSGMPAPLAALVIITEFFCSIALIGGVVTRLAAVGILALMIGAIAMVHLKFGFFMNWMGTQAGEGFEYHLLAIGLALVLIIAERR
jgi:putative oxidoreductase